METENSKEIKILQKEIKDCEEKINSLFMHEKDSSN